MITHTSSDAEELIGLAERMGIPVEDAVHHFLKDLTYRQLTADVVEPGCSVGRMNLQAGVDGTRSPTLRVRSRTAEVCR